MKFFVTATLAAMLVSSTAFADVGAAVLGSAQGKVLINHGKGFEPAAPNTALRVGDRVMVGQESLATISFEECQISLERPTVFTVTNKAPCSGGAPSITPTAFSPAAVPLPVMIIGTGVVVGGTYILVKEVFHKNNRSVSAP